VLLHLLICRDPVESEGTIQVTPEGEEVEYEEGTRCSKFLYNKGDTVSLKAKGGYRTGSYFDHWSGDLTGVANPAIVKIDCNKKIVAVFGGGLDTVKLTTGAVGSGSVIPSSRTYNKGSIFTLVAQPGAGYAFNKWTGDVEGTIPVPSIPSYLNVVMDRDRHIVANFTKDAAPTPPEPKPPPPPPPIPPPPPPSPVTLLARADRVVDIAWAPPPTPILDVQLLDRFSAEVDTTKLIYLLAKSDTVVSPEEMAGITLLARYSVVVGTSVTGIMLLDKHEVVVEAVGEPVPPEEPEEDGINWWLWGSGIALIAVAVVIGVIAWSRR